MQLLLIPRKGVKVKMYTKEHILKLVGVSKIYGFKKNEAIKLLRSGATKEEIYKKTNCTVALWDVNIAVPKGEIFVIIGLSGCGKSTALRCFNGLTIPTAGEVFFANKEIGHMTKQELLAYRRNKISMVFQSFGLMDHRDVLGNVVYGPEVKGLSKEECNKIARQFIALVGLEGWEHEQCSNLSGGMRQRVGIARALANDPEVLLMDEPFSALDPLVRSDMQFELLQIQQKLQKTIVFITHDIDEAFKMGNTICIMKEGQVVQIGTPEEITMRPATDYVQHFIQGATKTKVVSVSNIMVRPASIVRIIDSIDHALHQMRSQSLSSVIVIDNNLGFAGFLSLKNALQGKKEGKSLGQLLERDTPKVAPETPIADIIPLASEAIYPLVVVDEHNVLLGIVTKASILSSLI